MTKPAAGRSRDREIGVSRSRDAGDLDGNVVRLLWLGFRIAERRLLRLAAEEGFDDIRLPHFPILRGINEGFVRMTEIASSTGITKQTAGALGRELEVLGYIGRHPDPQDGRAKIVRFTSRGRAFMRSLPAMLRQTEGDLSDIVGPEELARLASALRTIIGSGSEEARTPPGA